MPKRRSGTKKCTSCDRSKPTSEFYIDSRCQQGVKPLCKDCYREKSNEYGRTERGRKTKKRHRDKKRGKAPSKYHLEETEGKRVCRYCQETKPLDNFRKGSKHCRFGRTYECKECSAKGIEAKRQNPEYRKKEQQYRRTEKALATARKRVQKYRDDHPERVKAIQNIRNMVQAGKFPKASMCVFADEMCSGRFEHHHFDYSKPDETIPLCKYHHVRLRLGLEKFQKQIEKMLAEFTE